MTHPTSDSQTPYPTAPSPTRRAILRGGVAGLGLLFLLSRPSFGAAPVLGFAPVGTSNDDFLHVPYGYAWRVVHAWGDPIEPGGPAWEPNGTGTAADQLLQVGMHHDGMHLFPVADRPGNFLLAVNHEYTDEGLLHAEGQEEGSKETVLKSKHAHGVSIVEIRRRPDGSFGVVASPFARRITAETEIRIAGPGSELIGTAVRGTVANCAAGQTPWGTYLTCEENFQNFFVRKTGTASEGEKRYGIGRGGGLRWEEHDARFRVDADPEECKRFGWVVEIDPYAPGERPVKRTALGRFRHENAFVRATLGRPVAVYMGDDEAGEHLYKFVSKAPLRANAEENRDLLDQGTLYVARLLRDGRGEWLALEHGKNGLVGPRFPDQASVLVLARAAATEVGATPLDRPEWVAMSPGGRVFVNLTNGPTNPYGHVLAIDEDGNEGHAVGFRHEVFATGGARFEVKGSPTNDAHPALGSPDGLFCDSRGVLWVQTDVASTTIDAGNYAGFGANQMVAVDPATLEARRFLVGPRGCEVTGIAFTPDLRVLFVNIQHPGESPAPRKHLPNVDRRAPARSSSWPASDGESRPRSATVAIWKSDGGLVGS